MDAPMYKINVLSVCDMSNDWSFLVNKFKPGVITRVPTYSYLITGENIPPILVDTGVREDGAPHGSELDFLGRVALESFWTPEQSYETQLAKFGYKPEDIGIIIHTHLHVDHAGNDCMFPQAKIIMPRKELMFAVSDMMDEQYPMEYITYLVEQIHVPGKVRLIDETIELVPGIVLEPNEGHTWGSLNIRVNTKQGLAICCGDVIYDEMFQCKSNPDYAYVEAQATHPCGVEQFADRTTGNFWNIWEAKKAVQHVMRDADIVLPSHDALVMKKYGDTIG